MKSKRKQIGRVLYTRGNTKRRRCFKNRATKRNLLIKTLKNLLVDLQLKYQNTIFREQMNLMRQNKVQELLKYVKTLKHQSRKLDQEQLREFRNDRKLEESFRKLRGIEQYLKDYNSQLNKAITEQQGEAQTASGSTYGNNSFESVKEPHEETVKTSVHFMDKTSSRNVAKRIAQNIPSALVLAERRVGKKDNSIKTQNLRPKNASLRRLKSKNSFEKLLLAFLHKFEKPKTAKPESILKNKSNKAEIDQLVKRQGPISTKLVYKWPVSISAVVLAKHKRKNSRRKAFWHLRQVSPAVNNSHYQSREQLMRMAVQEKQRNLHDYGSVSASQILKRRKIKHRDQMMELKWKPKIMDIQSQDERILHRNVYNINSEISTQTSLKSGRKKRLRKIKGNLSSNARHLDKFSWDSTTSTDSEMWEKHNVKSETMDMTASKIINSLIEENPIGERFKEKTGKRVVVPLSANQFTPQYEKSPLSQVDDVFDDLIEKNNEWQEYMRDLEGSQDIIKSYLRKRYLQNVRTVLQNQVYQITQENSNLPLEGEETGTRPLSWSAFDWYALNKNSENSLSSTASKNVSQIDRYLYRSSTLEMHRRFFTEQMMKLRKAFVTKNIKHLYDLIMNRELPIKQEDRDLLNEYALDPQHYNILIMAIEPTLPQSQSEVKIALIESNFNYIKGLMERDRRRSRTMASSLISCQMSQSDIAPKMNADDGISGRSQFNFDKEYIKKQRAKWAKYFALQEKTPLELQLANKRTLKLQAKAARKALKKQRQMDAKKHLQISRSLSALYTEPRLTQRMRKVLNEMTEDKRENPLEQTRRKKSSTFSSVTTEPRSCCSRCNMWQHDSCSLAETNCSLSANCP